MSFYICTGTRPSTAYHNVYWLWFVSSWSSGNTSSSCAVLEVSEGQFTNLYSYFCRELFSFSFHVVAGDFNVILRKRRRLKSNKATIHVNLCVALLVANVVLLGGLDKTSDKVSNDVIYSTHDVTMGSYKPYVDIIRDSDAHCMTVILIADRLHRDCSHFALFLLVRGGMDASGGNSDLCRYSDGIWNRSKGKILLSDWLG